MREGEAREGEARDGEAREGETRGEARGDTKEWEAREASEVKSYKYVYNM